MNNEIKFDPQTGKPIAGAPNASPLASGRPIEQPVTQPTPQPIQQPTVNIPPIDAPTMQNNTQIANNNINNIQHQMQSIPTVEQNKQEFINKTNAATEIKEEKKEAKPNIAFIIILFAIILAAMFFLFPYLLDVIG